MRFSLTALAALSLTTALAQTFKLPEVAQWVPIGTSTATLVTFGDDPKIAALKDKLAQAMRNHVVEAFTLIAEAKPGEPLPYQSWYGITATQYDSVLKAKSVVTAKGTETLTVTKLAGDGSAIRLNAGGTLAALNGTQINFRTDKVSFPKGQSKVGEAIDVTDESGLGARQGRQWQFEQGEFLDDNYVAGRLVILRLNDSGKVLVNYRMSGEPAADLSFTLDPR